MASAFESRVDEAHPFGVSHDDVVVAASMGKARLAFTFRIPERFYLYREKFEIALDDPAITATLDLPEATRQYDEFMERELEIYQAGELEIAVDLDHPEAFGATSPVTGVLSYQGCSDVICYRLMTQKFSIVIAPPTTATATATGSTATVSVGKNNSLSLSDWLRVGDFKTLLSRGTLFTVLITFLAGCVTAFTPCVYPIIPLTLAFMGIKPLARAHSHTEGRSLAGRRSLAGWRSGREMAGRVLHLLPFVAGLCLMNTALALIAIRLGLTFGFVFQSPFFLAFLVLLFLGLGLWMFGVLNINLPSALLTRVQRVQPTGAWRGFYVGLTIGILALPCVGPIQAPLLVYIAGSKDYYQGSLFMMSYSLGLAGVFFLLAFASQTWTAGLGAKTLWVKRLIALLLLGVALFYAWVLARPFLEAVMPGLSDHGASYFGKDLAQGLKKADQRSKIVVVDFYADWCLPCHEWDQKVFANNSVKKAILADFVPVRIDCTRPTEACNQAVDRFRVIGWPTLVFVSPDGAEIKNARLTGVVLSPEEFLQHLSQTRQEAP